MFIVQSLQIFSVKVFGIVSVQSLWSYWKDEKSVFRSLQELGNVSKTFSLCTVDSTRLLK